MLSMYDSKKHARETARRLSTSPQRTPGHPNFGSPWDITPTVFTPRLDSGKTYITMIDRTTTNRATGFLGNSRSPRINIAIDVNPTPRVGKLVSRMFPKTPEMRIKKLLPVLGTPNSFGSWVEAITRPAPTLKPVSTVSETKLVTFPKCRAHAMMPTRPATILTAIAMWAWRTAAPVDDAPSADPMR